MIITFVATKKLTPGVLPGDGFQIDIDVEQFDRNQEERKTQNVTLAGNRETNLLYSLEKYQITTVPMQDLDLDEFRMFIASTAAGEDYSITDTDDGSTIAVITEGTPQQSRVIRSGTKYYRYTFTSVPPQP